MRDGMRELGKERSLYSVCPPSVLKNIAAVGKGLKVFEITDDNERIPEDKVGIFTHRKQSRRTDKSIGNIDLLFVDGDHSYEGWDREGEFAAGGCKFQGSYSSGKLRFPCCMIGVQKRTSSLRLLILPP